MMHKFPHINQFYQIKQRVEWYCEKYEKQMPVMDFTGRLKLHGTNTGIRRFEGQIIPQGRNRVLTLDNDECGFARHIATVPVDVLNAIFDQYGSKEDDISIYGEWVGKGIQSKVACAQIEQKHFVAFNIMINGKLSPSVYSVKSEEHHIYNIDMVDKKEITIDFANIDVAIQQLEDWTREVEDACPWGKKFGIDGIGEGLVWFWSKEPVDSTMWFKTKGQKHTKDRKVKSVTADPVKVASIDEFCEKSLTNERLMQGWDHTKDKIDKDSYMQMKHLGTFLKFISKDVLRECVDILDVSGLVWKDVEKTLTTKAKEWYVNKLLSP